MIRIAISSSQYPLIQEKLSLMLQKENIDYTIDNYHRQVADMYIIDLLKLEDIPRIQNLLRDDKTLCYVIGPQDYQLVSECIKCKVHLYLSIEHLKQELEVNQEQILQDIQERFRFYVYKKQGMESQIRLAHIYFVESLRHHIVIHSVNGTFVERKNLKSFLKEINDQQFIQIHKSYVVNKNFIQCIKTKEVVLENAQVLPIGRAYRLNVQEV